MGSPALFAIVWTSLASSMYFSLGVVADHALGLTPVVFLVAALFFGLTVMTYVEGASLHQERAGSTVFARYAFNELWSFVAGWAILLDFLIVMAITAFAAANYLATFWSELGHGAPELAVAVGILLYVAVRNVRGAGRPRYGAVVVADIALQLVVVGVGLAMFAGDLDTLTNSIDLGRRPAWDEFVFALTVGTIALTSLEAASGLAGEVQIGRRGLRRLVSSGTVCVLVVYTGIALVAVTAVPVTGGSTPLAGSDAPVIDVVDAFDEGWATDLLRYAVAGVAAAMLVLATNAAMLGLSRLTYSLATNRQIPSALGRLHPRWATPYVALLLAAVLAAALVATKDLEFLVGLYAFGALLAFTIAHLAICVLRYREADRPRPYRIPVNVRVGGGDLPLPAVLGAVASAAAFVALLIYHDGARFLGLTWMAAGLLLYVVYRRTTGKPLTRRVSVPAAALRADPIEAEYGSILVPIFGTPLDDDIVQTAGRLAADEHTDEAEGEGATIEALWVFEVPVSLPLDARLPEEQLKRARAALARAKAVGEEYEGVEVATATVRARSAGEAIVGEAERRGVEVIVLAAEEPSRIRGGGRLGGTGGPLDNFVGEATKYVVRKAPCRVILTAPPSTDTPGADVLARSPERRDS
jgi:APA family basic amino acid/polyamine antiporter